MMIVIDYDAGNTANVLRALKRVFGEKQYCLQIQRNSEGPWTNIAWSRSLSFCNGGVGNAQLIPAIKEAVAGGTPLLGICWMQLLLEEGLEHQPTQGLGLIPGTCRPILPRGWISCPPHGMECFADETTESTH